MSVRVLSTIEIRAPIDLVWRIQAEIDAWPRWNQGVKSSALRGPLAPGTEFRWKAGGMRIRSRLDEVTPPTRLAWSGKAAGLRAVHAWRFSRTEQGTRVETEESMEGLLARLLAAPLRKTLERTLREALEALKTEAERQASRTTP